MLLLHSLTYAVQAKNESMTIALICDDIKIADQIKNRFTRSIHQYYQIDIDFRIISENKGEYTGYIDDQEYDNLLELLEMKEIDYLFYLKDEPENQKSFTVFDNKKHRYKDTKTHFEHAYLRFSLKLEKHLADIAVSHFLAILNRIGGELDQLRQY